MATKTKTKVAIPTKHREEWLNDIAQAIRPRIEDVTGKMTPDFRISVGFPSRGALSLKRRVHGQCFNKLSSKDGTFEMFITPLLSDPVDVAAVVAHELVHCNDENVHGHGPVFARVAYAIGLAGKPTATVAGDDFKAFINPIIKKVGKYPHGGMQVNAKYKPAPTRLLKAYCPQCKYTVRVTKMWVEQSGAPICPEHKMPFVVEGL